MEAGQNGSGDPTTAQKAFQVLDLIAQGWRFNDARARVKVGTRAVQKVRGVLSRRPDLEPALRDGSLSLTAALAESGYVVKTGDMALGVQFARGDAFALASEAMIRYLEKWQLQGFEFKHVNPKEARSRLARLDYIDKLVAEMRPDLENRAVEATLSVRK